MRILLLALFATLTGCAHGFCFQIFEHRPDVMLTLSTNEAGDACMMGNR